MAMLGGECSACCGGGVCVCDATSVTVSVSCGNFLRHLLLQASSGAEAKGRYGYIAAPASGVHVLRKDTVAVEAGQSSSKWVSDPVASPGSGRITAVVYRASSNTPVRVTVGIPVWYWRSIGSEFKSLEQMIAESNAQNVLAQGYGTLVVEIECDSQTGRVLSYSPLKGDAWSPIGSQIPLVACDFTDANAVLGGSYWWEGAALRKGQERSLSQGMSIVSDTRTGDNIVTLNGVDLTCCDDELDGACCEGTACSVKPQCQCQGTGKTFKGVGTTCTPNPCVNDPCVNSCTPLQTHPVYLSMSVSNFTGAVPRDFAINTTRQIERKLFNVGTETCWAYSYLLQSAGHQCPNPFGGQAIDGYLLSAIFSQNECRFFANYKDASGQCHRYNIYWSMPLTDTYTNVLCQRLFPISGSVSSSGISFDYSINVNPLP